MWEEFEDTKEVIIIRNSKKDRQHNGQKKKEHTRIYKTLHIRRVWRYQWGNQNPYIEEEQTTQWPKEKGQKEKQRSTKHYTENKRSSNTNPKNRVSWTTHKRKSSVSWTTYKRKPGVSWSTYIWKSSVSWSTYKRKSSVNWTTYIRKSGVNWTTYKRKSSVNWTTYKRKSSVNWTTQ